MRDLVVVGGGPCGYTAAIRAAQLGMQVSLVEKEKIGGACLNWGCIPTKTYYSNASTLRVLSRISELNVSLDGYRFDMAGAKQRKDNIVTHMSGGVTELLKANNVEVIKGTAVIAARTKIRIDSKIMDCRHLLIASGASPILLNMPGSNLPGVMTCRDILDLDSVPERLVIIGAGAIGIEFAYIFSTFGSRVIVLEGMPSIIPQLDQELGKRLAVYLKRQQIALHTGIWVHAIEQHENRLRISAKGSSGEMVAEADTVLIAAGMKPQIKGLGLEEVGVTVQDGAIAVNSRFQTSVEGIYAAGDVIGGFMLAHVAAEEGIAAVEGMAGMEHRVAYHAVPQCIFSFPEIASVGLTEEMARARRIQYSIGRCLYGVSGQALAMGEAEGQVKVIADPSGSILGVHIIGFHATELIQEAVLMVHRGMKIMEVGYTMHTHPTLGEVLKEAVLDAAGQAIHVRRKAKK
jgi:dihydrolipoamide dehydrogenase